MFTFAQTLAIVTALLSTATALPKLDTGLQLEERATTVPSQIGLYVCDEAVWTGNCHHLLESPGVCHTFPNDLLKNITAVGPDNGQEHGASGCTLYETATCGGEYLAGTMYPGESDLSKAPAGGRYNDFFQSYICY